MFDMHSNCSNNSDICTQIKKHIHISWQQWAKEIFDALWEVCQHKGTTVYKIDCHEYIQELKARFEL